EAGRRAVALCPEMPDAHNNLGITLLNAGHPEEAMSCFRRALDFRSDFASALNNLGNAIKELGLTGAEECYRKALAANPTYEHAMSNLAVILQERHRLDDSVELYRRVLSMNPTHAEACNNLGMVLLQQGKLREGIDTHRRAVALSPG